MAFTQAAGRENAKEEASAWWAFFSEGDLVNALRVKFKPMAQCISMCREPVIFSPALFREKASQRKC